MLPYIRFRRKLWSIERERRRFEGDDKSALDKAKKADAPHEEVRKLEAIYGQTQIHFQDEIIQLHTEYLIEEANRLLVPYPSPGNSEMWEKDGNGYVRMTPAGINKVRGDIRAERKARVELLLMWVPGVVGILGALIGLAAILTGRR